MTVIRVNPASVQAYGAEAQQKFDEIRAQLELLVSAVVEVRYFGPNAVQFKTTAGTIAQEFAEALKSDMRNMAEAIRTSTSNIAASLGGGAINIAVDGASIVAPAVASVDFVDVDTSALSDLTNTVTRHFTTIQAAFEQHQAKLEATDWMGTARENAVQAVGNFTRGAVGRCEETHGRLNTFITDQVDATLTADV